MKKMTKQTPRGGKTIDGRSVRDARGACGFEALENRTLMSAVALVTPTGLTAQVAEPAINLAWSDKDANAAGYYVLRSTDNVHFTQIGTVAGNANKTYSDAYTAYGTKYFYEVEAYGGKAISAASASVAVTTPTANVAITTRFGDETVLTMSGVDDSVNITQSGGTLDILADGKSYTDAVTTAGLFVYTRGGSDSIRIDSSVKSLVTLETIDGASTKISSLSTDVTAWVDSTDAFSGSGLVHKVANFAGGVSKATGAALANPTDSGATVKASGSLFGNGPVAADVNQGEVGDCYFLSSLAALAGQQPQTLVQSAVDMGDGTYTVQFENGNTPTFVRVSSAMPKGPFGGYMYAHPGSDGSIWAMVFEKAFAYYRTGANTFNSINSGWMGEVYNDFGVASTNFFPSTYTQSSFYNLITADLAAGDPITLGTGNSAPNLVSDHAYTLISAAKDAKGNTSYVVRNPWGVAGDALENSQGYATLTFAQLTANFADGCA